MAKYFMAHFLHQPFLSLSPRLSLSSSILHTRVNYMQTDKGEGESGMESHLYLAFRPWFGMSIIIRPRTPRNVLYKMIDEVLAYNDIHTKPRPEGHDSIPGSPFPSPVYSLCACIKCKRRVCIQKKKN